MWGRQQHATIGNSSERCGEMKRCLSVSGRSADWTALFSSSGSIPKTSLQANKKLWGRSHDYIDDITSVCQSDACSSPLSLSLQVDSKLVFIRDSLQLIFCLYRHDNLSAAPWGADKTEGFLTVIHRQIMELSACVSGHAHFTAFSLLTGANMHPHPLSFTSSQSLLFISASPPFTSSHTNTSPPFRASVWTVLCLQVSTNSPANSRLRSYYRTLANSTLSCSVSTSTVVLVVLLCVVTVVISVVLCVQGCSTASWQLLRKETKLRLEQLELLVASIRVPAAASRRRSAATQQQRNTDTISEDCLWCSPLYLFIYVFIQIIYVFIWNIYLFIFLHISSNTVCLFVCLLLQSNSVL